MRLMGEINHPNVLRLLEYSNDGKKTSKKDGSVSTIAYAVMEVVSGGDMFDYLA